MTVPFPTATAATEVGPKCGGDGEGEEAKERGGDPTGARPRSSEWCGERELGGAGTGRGSRPVPFRAATADKDEAVKPRLWKLSSSRPTSPTFDMGAEACMKPVEAWWK